MSESILSIEVHYEDDLRRRVRIKSVARCGTLEFHDLISTPANSKHLVQAIATCIERSGAQMRPNGLDWLGFSDPAEDPPPCAYVRGGYLYTEAADGRFYPIGDDIYLLVAAGAPQCFIQHAYKAPDATFRDLTEDERSRWTFEGRFKAWDVGDAGEWKPLPEYGR